ncbi:L37A2 protein, partial [Aegotheles bennettii]|nr:L37A2 protein [Aegotheles bennettii]
EENADAAEDAEDAEDSEDAEGVEGAEEAPSPRQDYVRTNKKHKQQDRLCPFKSNQLIYQRFGNVNPEEGPTPTESKAEQRLNTKQHFFYNLMVNNSPPTASSISEDMAEEEGSSVGGDLPAASGTTETPREQQKEGSSFLNKPQSSGSLGGALVGGDLFEAKVNHHLRSLVPDEALRTFITHTARALRMDCGLPELQLACAKLVTKVGLLVKLLNQRQDDPGASALTRCLQKGNISDGMVLARDADGEPAGKYTSSDKVLLAILVSFIIVINLTAICLMEACSRKSTATSQPQSPDKSQPGWFFPKLLPGGGRKGEPEVGEPGWAGSDWNQTTPQWLRDLYQPLDSQQEKSLVELYDGETSGEEEIFAKAELK